MLNKMKNAIEELLGIFISLYVLIVMSLMFLLISIISTLSFISFFKKVNITMDDVKNKIEDEGKFKSIKYILMPTRMGAEIIRNKNPEKFGQYIKDITKYNLILVITMVTLLLIADLFTLSDDNVAKNIMYDLYSKNIWWVSCIINITLVIVLVGGSSRIFEIFYAFYNDASTNLEIRKETYLKHYERVRLAMRSYLELFLWFAILYYAFGAMDKGLFKEGALNMIDAIYFSGVTITTLGYGDILPTAWLSKFIVIFEVLSGFTLIIVSFTIYVSRAMGEMDTLKDLNITNEIKLCKEKIEALEKNKKLEK